MILDLEKQKEHFKNHVATFTDYGNIKIVDFKNPESFDYRIRFLFEEDYFRLHISGDLGELIATNYKNMCYEKFSDFVDNTGYFYEKIDCHNRAIFIYDEDKAKSDLEEILNHCYIDLETYCYVESKEEAIQSIIDDAMDDFNDRTGLGSKAQSILNEIDSDCCYWIDDIGKEQTGILELYMLAFKLAQEQLKNKH